MEKKLRDFCLKHRITALWNTPLADYTSFRIGGPADAFLLPDTENAFVMLLSFLKGHEIPFRVIGNGTNLLFSDTGFRGAIISTRHMRKVSILGQSVRAAAGVPIGILCRMLADRSLGGLTSLYGIPGTVGGAVMMNAGAYDATISDHLTYVSVYRSEGDKIETLSRSEMKFSYRKSSLREESGTVILCAEFSFPSEDQEEIREKMRQIISK